jgi:hypothetical protein
VYCSAITLFCYLNSPTHSNSYNRIVEGTVHRIVLNTLKASLLQTSRCSGCRIIVAVQTISNRRQLAAIVRVRTRGRSRSHWNPLCPKSWEPNVMTSLRPFLSHSALPARTSVVVWKTAAVVTTIILSRQVYALCKAAGIKTYHICLLHYHWKI